MMTTPNRPHILFVDDAIEEIDSIAEDCAASADVERRTFDDLEYADLERADLVVVDFALDDWAARDRVTEITLRPADGLAVIEVLRSNYRQANVPRPVAFAVLSGNLERLTAPYPPARREHMIASLAKVEWAFQKGRPLAELSRQLISLALAVRALPPKWPHDSNAEKDATLHNLLMMPSAGWTPSAVGDLSRCHPPIQELSTWSHGLAFLRWMLQRILPYPTFLIDDFQAALRIGMSTESFVAALDAQRGFLEWLAPASYRGVLSEFRGRRWWRAGIDALLWELSINQPFNRELIASFVRALVPDAVFLAQSDPVGCVDKDYNFESVADARECVRLRPDDWPAFADSAWATRDVVSANQSLLMAVEDASERETLGANE